MTRRSPPLHPWFLALLPVFSMYAVNTGQGQGGELLMVATVILVVVTVIYAAAAAAYRDSLKAALLVSAFLLLFDSYDTLAAGLERMHGARLVPLLLVSCYGLLAALAVACYRTTRSLVNVTGLATAVTAGMLIIPVAKVAPMFLMARAAARGNPAVPPLPRSGVRRDPRPDIYYFIFDRYGSADTIRDAYGYDNQPFYRYLTDKGFFIADASRGNYIKTALSVASSLNFTLLDHVADTADSTDWGAVYDLLADHRLGRFLKAQGYSYVHVGSWWWPTRRNAAATRNINSYPFTPRPLMVMLNSRFVLPFTRRSESPWLDDRRQQWSRVNRDLAELANAPADSGPKFVFAHVLAPHPPYVFNRDGTFLTAEDAGRQSLKQGYVNQLIATNQKIVALIDRILADSNRRAVIVLQSDEGPYPTGTSTASFNWHRATRAQLLEKSGILNAYYFPDHETGDLYASITPVNSFRVVLNKYFGTALPLLPDRTYAHESDLHLYRMLDITNTVRAE